MKRPKDMKWEDYIIARKEYNKIPAPRKPQIIDDKSQVRAYYEGTDTEYLAMFKVDECNKSVKFAGWRKINEKE